MEIIRKLSNGLIEAEAEDILESLYEIGEWVEINLKDYEIIDKNGKTFLLK